MIRIPSPSVDFGAALSRYSARAPTYTRGVRGDLIAQAFAAIDAGDPTVFEALLDPEVKWIGVAGSWEETPT